ncbi:MAG: hypothetical protein WBD58_20395 [Geitlerinemataceae cyanobacterium]
MKTLGKWVVTGVLKVIFGFWLLGYAAGLVSISSNFKVGLGVTGYIFALLVIPVTSVGYVALKVADAKHRQKQIAQVFPDDTTTVFKLLYFRR